VLTLKKTIVSAIFTLIWLGFGVFMYLSTFFGGKKSDRVEILGITKSAIKAMWSWKQ
jgi:hypothetical protein